MDRYSPDGTPFPRALERARRLAVVAHPDDAEVMALAEIGRGVRGEPFALLVCTDGAGAPAARGGPVGAALVEARRREQRRAADLGAYAAVVQLGLPSADVRGAGWEGLVTLLAALLAEASAPEVVTHSPADRHPTHVAVAAAVVAGARRLPPPARPARLLGAEVWGGLDWLEGPGRVERDATGFLALGKRVLGAHRSQMLAKAYDRAAPGRRAANATFADPRAADDRAAVELALDLTPALAEDGPGLADIVDAAHAAAAAAARERLSAYPSGGRRAT